MGQSEGDAIAVSVGVNEPGPAPKTAVYDPPLTPLESPSSRSPLALVTPTVALGFPLITS